MFICSDPSTHQVRKKRNVSNILPFVLLQIVAGGGGAWVVLVHRFVRVLSVVWGCTIEPARLAGSLWWVLFAVSLGTKSPKWGTCRKTNIPGPVCLDTPCFLLQVNGKLPPCPYTTSHQWSCTSQVMYASASSIPTATWILSIHSIGQMCVFKLAGVGGGIQVCFYRGSLSELPCKNMAAKKRYFRHMFFLLVLSQE